MAIYLALSLITGPAGDTAPSPGRVPATGRLRHPAHSEPGRHRGQVPLPGARRTRSGERACECRHRQSSFPGL